MNPAPADPEGPRVNPDVPKTDAHQVQDDLALSHVDWETSLVANESRSRLLAWRVAGASLVVATAQAGALLTLVPLHTVVPYVVAVDRVTGDAEVLPSGARAVSADELGQKYWITQFVIARQRYLYALLQHDYDTVQRLAGPSAWAAYAALYDGPQALDRTLGDQTELLPSIQSVVLNGASTATVRLQIATRSVRGTISTQRAIATLRYEFKLPKRARESDLIENPFGFRVLEYRLDPELGGDQ